jgi:hypothetical protein
LRTSSALSVKNYVQEGEAKWPAPWARFADATLYFLGQIQSKKADEAVALFDVSHAVNCPSLVTALTKAMHRQNCFIHVSIGNESQKALVRSAISPFCSPPRVTSGCRWSG